MNISKGYLVVSQTKQPKYFFCYSKAKLISFSNNDQNNQKFE